MRLMAGNRADSSSARKGRRTMDQIRRFVRGAIGANSPLYRAGAETVDFLAVLRSEGIKTWRLLRCIETANGARQQPEVVSLNALQHPIYLRPGSADAKTAINNVIRQEYGQFDLPPSPRWMIDAGAYIGDTAAYFLSRFPSLKVIALEPNEENHDLASRNLLPYGERAILLKKGLSSSSQSACFAGDGTGGAIASEGKKIECISLAELLDKYSIPQLDILKMDIEGAEAAIFESHPESWLPRVDLIILEIHGPQIEVLVSKVLLESGFAMRQYRSVWYCRRKR
jgi:FkbM family methyltransferase